MYRGCSEIGIDDARQNKGKRGDYNDGPKAVSAAWQLRTIDCTAIAHDSVSSQSKRMRVGGDSNRDSWDGAILISGPQHVIFRDGRKNRRLRLIS
jgi:hypothetical protein